MIRSAHCLAFAAVLLSSFATLVFAVAPPPFPQPPVAIIYQGMGDAKPPVIGMTPSGRAYVAGPFTAVDGQPRAGIARFNPDGTLDSWAPTMPAVGVAHLAVEDANGNVAVAHGASNTLNHLVYIPAAGNAGAVVDTEPANTGRRFNRLAFDAAGTLYAAVSRRCSAAAPIGAEVKKYTGGTTFDASFAAAPGNVGVNGAACINALAVQAGSVYFGGRGEPMLMRVSAANGAVDATWRPAITGDVIDVQFGAAGTIYVAGTMSSNDFYGGLGRFSTSGTGERDGAWAPLVKTDAEGTMALDAANGLVYLTGLAGDAPVSSLVAVSTTSGAVVPTWNPGPVAENAAGVVNVRHLAVLADRLVVGGSFYSIGGVGYQKLAAVPLASAPVTWPVASLSAKELQFGVTFQDGVTRSRAFTITNTGAGNLVVSGVTFPPRPELSQTNDCSAPLPPGASCTVTVSMAMTPFTNTVGTGFFPSVVFLGHNGAGPHSLSLWAGNTGPFTYGFSGPMVTGTPDKPPLLVRFPPTAVGTSRTTEVTVTNHADQPLAIEEVRILPAFAPAGVFTQTNDCPASLPAGGRCIVKVKFAPFRERFEFYSILRLATDSAGPEAFADGTGSSLSADDDADGIPNGVEIALGRNPQVKDNDVFTNAQLFAMQQYRDFLGRPPEDSGSAFWAARLADGSISRPALIAQFLGSTEFEDKAAPVTRLYLSYLLRIPDYGGLDFWITRFRQGEALESISNQFASSPEFAARYGALDNAQFVDRVYRNVLGRAPDTAGLAFWTERLGAMTRGQLMLAFSESTEYRSLTTNQVFVTMIYAGMLKRAPDATGFSNWVSYLDAGNSREALIQAVLDSPEYRARFMP